METLILIVAIALAVLLVVRERWWRRGPSVLREQLKAASTRGLEREQLANVGQLVSGLAQELKSPLQGVLGNAEPMDFDFNWSRRSRPAAPKR